MVVEAWRSIPAYRQRLVHLEGDIGAPARLVWDTLTDWGGLLTWFNAVPDPIYPILSADLLDGQDERQIPRTRRAVFDLENLTGVVPEEVNEADFQMPPFVDEVLLLADETAYYLAYSYSDNFHPGITTIQLLEQATDKTRFVIKYTTLENVETPKLHAEKAEEQAIGDAFHDRADYRALKVYCEREWTRRSVPGATTAGG